MSWQLNEQKKHKYLQSSQIGVFVEEAGWNICNLVGHKAPIRK
jgi:hypothetical protein